MHQMNLVDFIRNWSIAVHGKIGAQKEILQQYNLKIVDNNGSDYEILSIEVDKDKREVKIVIGE